MIGSPSSGKILTFQGRAEENDEKEVREGVGDIGDAHHDVVDCPATEGGEPADRQANYEYDCLSAESDAERDPGSLEYARPAVASELIRTEIVG